MFDYDKLKKLQDNLKKQAFVPIDSKSAQAAPPGPPPGMDPAAMPPPGMDPAAMPPPGMDPAAAGGMPPPGMDPAAGGMPPPGMDPAMMGGDPAMGGLPPPPEGGDVSPDGEPYMKFTPSQLTKFIRQILALSHSECDGGNGGGNGGNGGNGGGPDASSGNDSAALAELNAKLDALLPALSGPQG